MAQVNHLRYSKNLCIIYSRQSAAKTCFLLIVIKVRKSKVQRLDGNGHNFIVLLKI